MFDHDGHEQTIQRLSDDDQPGEEGESVERIKDLTALIMKERMAEDGNKVQKSSVRIEKDVLQMERFRIVFLQGPFVVDTSKASDQTIDGDHRYTNRMNVHLRLDERPTSC